MCHRACTGRWAALGPWPGKRWRWGGGSFDSPPGRGGAATPCNVPGGGREALGSAALYWSGREVRRKELARWQPPPLPAGSPAAAPLHNPCRAIAA